MDTEGELQSQQPTLQGNKAPSQYSLLSQSMKDVFISIPITSLSFISITWVRSLEPANCAAEECQWHFKGGFQWRA